MNGFICERGIALKVNEFVERFGNEELLKLKKKFTIRTIDRCTKTPKVTPIYTVVKTIDKQQIIEFPRYCLKELKKYVVTTQTELSSGIKIPAEYSGQSNPNQQIVVQHVMDRFKDKSYAYNGATLMVDAGVGKTYIAMDLIGKIKRKTLIVVPTIFMLEQWNKLLKQYFKDITVGYLYGDEKCDGDIIIAVRDTLSKLKSFEHKEKLPLPNVGKTLKYMKRVTTIEVNDLLMQVGLTVLDESQMYVSPEYRKLFKRIFSRYTIGLSATPNIREDKLDRIHLSWVGPIVDANGLKNYSLAQDAFTSSATIIKYHAGSDHTAYKVRDTGLIDYQSIITTIVNDPKRNQLLIENILNLAKDGRYVFVFSDRRSHLEALYNMIEHEHLSENISLELPELDKKIILYGGSTEDTIDKAKHVSNIIFTTYQYSSTGVSIPKMDCLVLTTPRRSNMKQIINRVFRLGSDQTIERQIIDIVDIKLPISKDQWKQRLVAYRERGCKIIETNAY